jgi:hypothetical protein
VVIAAIEPNDLAFLDITDIGKGKDPTAVYSYQLRIGITDSNGLAKYSKLSVVDVGKNVLNFSMTIF